MGLSMGKIGLVKVKVRSNRVEVRLGWGRNKVGVDFMTRSVEVGQCRTES